MAVLERENALVGMDVARVVVETQPDATRMQGAHQLERLRKERAPVIAPVPAIVVPGEIEHQHVEGNLIAAQAGELPHEVLLVVAAKVRTLRLGAARKILEVEIRDHGAERVARDHWNRAAEL